MPTPNLGEADFLAALHDLMPQGPAWPREPGTLQDALLAAIAERTAAQHLRIRSLADDEAFPARTSEMLADWERAYGLPDGCGSEGDSEAERRSALLARIAERGDQSRAYFISVAAALGYTVTIEEIRPARIGIATIGEPIFSEPWIFTWRMHAPAGDDTPRLECVIRRIAPAHTTVLFVYS